MPCISIVEPVEVIKEEEVFLGNIDKLKTKHKAHAKDNMLEGGLSSAVARNCLDSKEAGKEVGLFESLCDWT